MVKKWTVISGHKRGSIIFGPQFTDHRPLFLCGYSVVKHQKEKERLLMDLNDPCVTAPQKRSNALVFRIRERERRSRCIKYLVQNDHRFALLDNCCIRGFHTRTRSGLCRAASVCRRLCPGSFLMCASCFESFFYFTRISGEPNF